MPEFKIITNNQERPFLYGYEVSEKILNSDFDYLSDDEKAYGFIKYRGRYYHLNDFMRHCPMDTEDRIFPSPWEGYLNDSAPSGVLISISPDCEQYKIATFIS